MSQNPKNHNRKQTVRFVSLLVMTLCTLATCTKAIEFDGEQTDPKLVINSLVEPGQPVKANISKSYFFLDNEANTTAPDDLVASLYVNDHFIGLMTRQSDTVWNNYEYDYQGNPIYTIVNVFGNNYTPNEGEVVKITASANGFDDAEGETSPLPKPLSCAVVDSKVTNWLSYYAPNYYGENEEDSLYHIDYHLELIIEITDPNPGETDYFRLRFDEGSHYDDQMNCLSYYAGFDDPIFGSAVAGNNYFDLDMAPNDVFTDMLFDGRSYRIKVPFYVSMNMTDTIDPDFFHINITMEHLCKEIYNYLNTCEQTDEITQFFSEPIQTYSNVKGGYGLVGGRNTNTLGFALPLSE